VLTTASGFAEWWACSLGFFLLLLTELHHEILFFATEVIIINTSNDRVKL
jgi:ABC-type taurine transport system ATPase subunit